jgi:hypothetical protein
MCPAKLGTATYIMAANSSHKTASVPNKKMQKDKSKLKGIVRLKGFTLLELLIVMKRERFGWKSEKHMTTSAL